MCCHACMFCKVVGLVWNRIIVSWWKRKKVLDGEKKKKMPCVFDLVWLLRAADAILVNFIWMSSIDIEKRYKVLLLIEILMTKKRTY